MLLRKLASTRETTEPIPARYDPAQKVSYVLDHGTWIPSYDAPAMIGTKKADLETGEDQKGQ